jgi:pyruvate formate lyase activating enzyme
VFLKGCSCRCAWCHNPESLFIRPTVEFYPSRCIGCGKCFDCCPHDAQILDGDRHYIDRDRCTGCGLCVNECYSTALVLKGSSVSIDMVMETILADKVSYQESGGGVTISGGEPVLQCDFVANLLGRCKEENIHTALQTAGNYNYELLKNILPGLDMVMYDLKAYDCEIYKKFIHGDRDLIFRNLEQMIKEYRGVIAVRTPCIGSVNDTEEEICNIVRVLSKMGRISYYQLLPYHGLGKVKYDALNIEYAGEFFTPDFEKIRALEDLAARFVPVFNQDRGMVNETS